MAGRQAKVLSEWYLRRALTCVGRRSMATRDRAILLLSVRAGLRACEISGLDWSMVLDDRGRIAPTLEIRDCIAKRGSGRRIPMHHELKRALDELKRESDASGPLIRSRKTGARLSANSIVNWFVELYAAIGARGCSSHSGRRTFITQAARSASRAGASLRDVQLLAGHRSIETTQSYIEGDSDAQRRLVMALTSTTVRRAAR